MKLARMYIENFMCHEHSYVNFLDFNSALIVGKVENNDLFSNGVGKSTIFKAIEYGLFNQADVNLEKIIRDDSSSCKITIDFIYNNEEYRLIRLRTKKNTTDISLYKRNSVISDAEDIYHKNNLPITSDKFWQDLSGRRAADTEKELAKILKINFKSFRSTVHFMQNDFSGLATSTPEKRKGILKEALNLAIYSKLEKLAKDKANQISKEIDKNKTLLDHLKDPLQDIKQLELQLLSIEEELIKKNDSLDFLNLESSKLNTQLTNLVSDYSLLESNFINLINKEKSLLVDNNKLSSSIKEYSDKKLGMIKSANEVIAELKALKEEQTTLQELNFNLIEKNNEFISINKEFISENNANIKNFLSKILELKEPLASDSVCKHCRQPVSIEYREKCQNELDKEISILENKVIKIKSVINEKNIETNKLQQEVIYLSNCKQKLEKISEKIISKNQELLDKKSLHAECVTTLNNLQSDLKLKEQELFETQDQIKNSSKTEADKVKSQIEVQKNNIKDLNNKINSLNKEITHLNNSKAVIAHNIDQKKKDLNKKEELSNNLLKLNKDFSLYPSVLQAFSSTGIPNLFIQNVLDDLQVEANYLLDQLKPGLQLSFFVEKTKDDGTDTDTLDILYHINGKERQYDQLSGAQKLAVTFSLKLGLSFLLQKMIGTDIKFLLLDEIDQSLDKAGVDAFADIVKFFQKDFTILVITHNDRLKDKFQHAILVEQDINMVSRAKVVSSW
jgi:DNA repair exonuclease SbcCD ATPase subunit